MTIQSAAISFYWPPSQQHDGEKLSDPNSEASSIARQVSHDINLIDTPGHADFNFEVLRSLRILDGAVCILDGVAGVEAQTDKVWSQAANYKIPKIIFINKLDRDGVSYANTIREIAARLHTWPAVCQIPWWEGGKGRFTGLGDPINLRAYRWPQEGDGKKVEVLGLDKLVDTDQAFCEEIRNARTALVNLLSNHDEAFDDKFLELGGDDQTFPSTEIIASLRRCVINESCNVVPVFGGSSLRNIGVQPLLDAVVQLLPSPDEAPNPEINLDGVSGTLGDLLKGESVAINPDDSKDGDQKAKSLATLSNKAIMRNFKGCALAFKVVNDSRRGVLVYVRVYSGTIHRSATLFNTNLNVSEKALNLWKMYADDSANISELSAGQIGVIPGLKFTRTGDTLISYTGASPKLMPPAPLSSLQLRPIDIPPALFYSSIEPKSLAEQKAVSVALTLLLREDPSLQISVNEESGQTQLSGLGDFHLEIAADRLINNFKAKANVGKIEVAYRESIKADSKPQSYLYDKETAGKRTRAGCIATVSLQSPTPGPVEHTYGKPISITQDGNVIATKIAKLPSSDPASSTWNLPTHLPGPILHSSLLNGALAALNRGVTHYFPCHGIQACLTIDPTSHLFGNESTPAAISSAARLATTAALNDSIARAGSTILETVMKVVISVDEANLGAVSSDLSSTRGGHIISLEDTAETDPDFQPIDISRVYAPPDPFATTFDAEIEPERARSRNIVATVPLQEMVGYVKALRKLTAGRGTFVMSPDRFERVTGHRRQILLKELGVA